MILKKKAKTFNDYDLSLSYGQLEAIMGALERDHADPVADELFAELQWYMQRVPGPGEEEDEAKAREEGAAETGAGTTGDVEGEDVPIPMPPTEGGLEGAEEAPPEPPGAEGEGEELPPPEGLEGEGGFEGGPEAGLEGAPPPEEEELPAPPAA